MRNNIVVTCGVTCWRRCLILVLQRQAMAQHHKGKHLLFGRGTKGVSDLKSSGAGSLLLFPDTSGKSSWKGTSANSSVLHSGTGCVIVYQDISRTGKDFQLTIYRTIYPFWNWAQLKIMIWFWLNFTYQDAFWHFVFTCCMQTVSLLSWYKLPLHIYKLNKYA